jgi:hypothetical protein
MLVTVVRVFFEMRRFSAIIDLISSNATLPPSPAAGLRASLPSSPK